MVREDRSSGSLEDWIAMATLKDVDWRLTPKVCGEQDGSVSATKKVTHVAGSAEGDRNGVEGARHPRPGRREHDVGAGTLSSEKATASAREHQHGQRGRHVDGRGSHLTVRGCQDRAVTTGRQQAVVTRTGC